MQVFNYALFLFKKRMNLVLIALITTTAVYAQTNIQLAKSIAATIMNTYTDSMVVMKYSNHLMQDNLLQLGQKLHVVAANKNFRAN